MTTINDLAYVPSLNVASDTGSGTSFNSSFYSDPSQILQANIPPITLTASDLLSGTSTDYNTVNGAPATGSGSGITYNDINAGLNTIGALARLGTQTYATVNQIETGNSAPYAFQPGQLNPSLYNVAPAATADPGTTDPTASTASSFSFASLYDFSTPYPYAIGGGLLLLAIFAGSSKKKSGRG